MALIPSESASYYATHQWEYDVFLSCRGRDVFVNHLYAALKQKGITTFIDDIEILARGEPTVSEPFEVVEKSRISVIILSKYYASSTWCLGLLIKILKCQKRMGQIVFPVFYGVTPYNVGYQKDCFAEVFAKLEGYFRKKLEVQRWRAALNEVSNISGWHSEDDMPDSNIIQQIVKEIMGKLGPSRVISTKLLVGIDSRAEEIISDLGIGLPEVRMLGICGMGGIGKSTIARVIYDRLSNQFEGSCFLPDVRDNAERNGLICLQKRLLSDIFMEGDAPIKIFNVYQGLNLIKNRLRTRKILLILDDVDQIGQLEKLALCHDCFGLGSRIIITLRDEHLLRMHGVDLIYRPKELNYEEALALFSFKSFKKEHPPTYYMEMSNHILKYAAGLPLAIDVLGSLLYGRTIQEWQLILKDLELHPMREIDDVLKISFDDLEIMMKEVFLHIACFFKGSDKYHVIEILNCIGIDGQLALLVLIDKSLIEISSDNKLCMHNLLQQMGRKIVCQECKKEPGKRSRLWEQEDIDYVLTNNTGTNAIQAIFLDLPLQKEVQCHPKAFSNMPNLQLLKIRDVQLPHGLTHFPNELGFLEWSGYPLKYLPPNFQPNKLGELNMCHSNIEILWERVKFLCNLKFIKLSHSQNLMRTPDFTGVPNLQKIDLEGCTSLIEVHSSVGVLKWLTFLNLKDCISLRLLPRKFETRSLEILNLSGCSKIKNVPEFENNMQGLQELYLNGTAIEKLPSSIKHLTNLTIMDLSHCQKLVQLPDINFMSESPKVIVSGCSKLDESSQEYILHRDKKRMFKPEFSYEHETDVEISNEEGRISISAAATESSVGPSLSGSSKLVKIPESEIMSISPEKRELSSAHGTGVMEEKGRMPILETDVEISDEEGRISISEAETESFVELSLSGSSKLGELPEPEIMPISLEKYELLSAHGTEVMEAEGKMPILDTEIESLPSQAKEEGWTEFKLTKHAGELIEPLAALAVSTSGTSKQAERELVSVTMLPSGKGEIEIAPIDGHLLLEVSTCPKRSIERTSLNILRYMSDVTVRRIGVHGSGGIGKTSVLKALINYPIIKDLFDVVIWVTVSRNWSTRKIQDEVLRQLSLSSEDLETDYEIAVKLFQVLKSQRFLLLLDDVWEQIDLDAVGIPNCTLKNSSRIILATRYPDVCHIMAADREVPVERLLPEEAWELFQEQVGSIIDCPYIHPYAHDMVQKCGGLPLLIIVTGRALAKENDALRWMHASREFSRCSAHGIYGFKSIVRQMKFSYDRLEGPDLKSCLLYCALLPEDREVSIFELVEYWIEEGLISGNCTDTYKRGYDIVGVLVGAYLLQSSECGLSIKMHDLIRDLASMILTLEEGCQFLLRRYSKMTMQTDMGDSSSYKLFESFQSNRPSNLHGHQFLLRAGAGLTEPPLKDEWEEAKMIFLIDNELSNLPERPNCPKLLALFLQKNHQLRVIPSSFFDLMPYLTILNLSKTRIKSLPKSLFKVMRLKALILRNCARLAQLPSGIGSLGQLEVLDLQGTEIEKLPDEISELASLRHLKVSFYGSVNQSECVRLPHELVPHGIISSLCELETLSIDVYPGDKRWDKNVDSILNEMGNLTKLITFCCYFPEVKFLECFLEKSLSWKIKGLTDFKFVVGHDFKRFVYQVGDNLGFEFDQWGQCLKFVNGEMIPRAILEVLTCSTAFFLDHHIKVCSLSEFGISNLNGLKLCIVRDCPKIEIVTASKELVIFPILEHLSIRYLSNLGRLWDGMIPQGSFDKLRILTVHACPKLQFVFASSMLQFFHNLEEMIVEHCPAITEIIFQDQVVDSGSGTLPRLKTLKLHCLPELVTIMQGAWPPLENISFYNCPMLKKLGIDSNTCHSIKDIKAENHWWEKLEWQDTSIRSRLHAHFTHISDYNL